MRPGEGSASAQRAGRMLQLVPYLISRGEVSVTDAAAAFDVDEDEMLRMVHTLTVVGRPGHGGFAALPDDLFDIDWDLLERERVIAITQAVGLERAPRLSAREAAALLAGLQLVRAMPAFAASPEVDALIRTLSRGSATGPAEVVVAPVPVDRVRTVVDRALADGVSLSFTYKRPDGPQTTRTVDPVRVHVADGQWYLQGWCHLRQAMRTFHLDRVSDVTLTDRAALHRADPVPELFAAGPDEQTVRIRFPAASAGVLAGYLAHAEVVGEGPERTAEVRVADPCALKRVAAAHAGHVEILDPPEARRAAARWAQAGLDQYVDVATSGQDEQVQPG